MKRPQQMLKVLTITSEMPVLTRAGALTQIKRHRMGLAERDEKGSLTHGKKTPEKRWP
jgi:hypothetical protein